MHHKKLTIMLTLVIFLGLLAGCGAAESAAPTETVKPTAEHVGMGNPWVEYATLAEAEAAVGFSFSLPEIIAGSYVAEAFYVCNGELMEVVYRDDTFVVTVRKQAGEHPDISGNYSKFDHSVPFEEDDKTGVVKYNDGDTAWLSLIIYDGYSYSLDAPNGYWGDSAQDFLIYIYGEA